MLAVWKRELQSYFTSPIAYVFISVYMSVCGYYFSTNNVSNYNAEFNSTMGSVAFVFILIIPILTMRLLSEDRRNKTDQLLLTAPLSVSNMVLGKYLGAITVFLMGLLLSLVYPISMAIFGNPAWGEIFCAMFGFFLLGSSLVALGLFVSSTTDSQIVACIITLVVVLLLYVGNTMSSYINVAWVASVVSWLSIFKYYTPFYSGLLDLPSVVYFISFSAIFVFLAIRNVEKRRWSEA